VGPDENCIVLYTYSLKKLGDLLLSFPKVNWHFIVTPDEGPQSVQPNETRHMLQHFSSQKKKKELSHELVSQNMNSNFTITPTESNISEFFGLRYIPFCFAFSLKKEITFHGCVP
jgi:hypothetical protein